MSAPTDLVELPQAAADTGHLRVSELFGPTFQGEGPSLGRRCTFLRLGGCNLHCSWCDTPYTWDWRGRNGTAYDPRVELRSATASALWPEIAAQQTGMLVITGGEPMLQQANLLPLVEMARAAGWWIEIETAGTVPPAVRMIAAVDRFNVSPKLANSGNELALRERSDALASLQATGKASWKFVVEGIQDLDEVAELTGQYGLHPIWIMPEGINSETLARRTETLAAAVLSRGWNMTTRLHVLIWGNKRGV